MAYINAEEVKAIRVALKAKFPKLKFGCRKSSGSLGVDVVIKEGNVDFSTMFADCARDYEGNVREFKGNVQVNQYAMDSYNAKQRKVFATIFDIIKTAPANKWFDESDSMTDYFHTAFYIHLEVGEWNKPYVLVKK
jgi:hypothetical protein